MGTDSKKSSAMAEEGTAMISSPSSSILKTNSPFSSPFRFMRFSDQSNPSPTPGSQLELDECDVVWPTDAYSDRSSGGGDSPISNRSVSGEIDSSHRRPPFRQGRFGLSAALAEDNGPPVQKRLSSINVPAGRPTAGGMSKILHQSAPVNVPVWPKGLRKPVGALMEVDEGDAEDEVEDEMLPPHLIVARSQVMTFSVFEGVGRTLKGRDLRRVRNAVFRQTGFLD